MTSYKERWYILDPAGRTPVRCSSGAMGAFEYTVWSNAAGKDAQVVAQVQIEGVLVSTIFIGSDHGAGGPPILFETMVFDVVAGQLQTRACADRYATWAEAEAGHELAVAAVQLSLRSETEEPSKVAEPS